MWGWWGDGGVGVREPAELGLAFGHCAGGRENIVREQRQERAQQANPTRLRGLFRLSLHDDDQGLI
jgi:hypothetical protein